MTPKANILIAEDDVVLRDLYVKKFAANGYKIRTAANGEEAIAMINQEAPDAMIADIHMPRMDGFELLKKYPKNARNFPIILLTNFDHADFKLRALELGADDFFVKKDMTIRSLLEMVERLVPEKK